MRAIAIILVLLFHYPFATNTGQLRLFAAAPVHGGFLGVGVFFVLSGFLITTLLLEERARHGTISLRAFYVRRALRLLPAFFVLFAFAVGCFVLLGTTDPVRPSGPGLIGMLLYVANWVQIWSRGSLGVVFGHTWSLAIEEQFYVAFPVIALLVLGARARRATLALVVGLFSYNGGLFWGVNGDWEKLPDLHDFVLGLEHSFEELQRAAAAAAPRGAATSAGS